MQPAQLLVESVSAVLGAITSMAETLATKRWGRAAGIGVRVLVPVAGLVFLFFASFSANGFAVPAVAWHLVATIAPFAVVYGFLRWGYTLQRTHSPIVAKCTFNLQANSGEVSAFFYTPRGCQIRVPGDGLRVVWRDGSTFMARLVDGATASQDRGWRYREFKFRLTDLDHSGPLKGKDVAQVASAGKYLVEYGVVGRYVVQKEDGRGFVRSGTIQVNDPAGQVQWATVHVL